MDKKFLSDIELIKKASQTKKLVVFVGSGVSVNSGVPNWFSLTSQLKDDIGISEYEAKDDLQIAQIYFNEKKHKEYVEKVRNVLKYKKSKYNKINEIIFDLNPEYVITTNYDDLLEQVIRKRALPFSVIKKDTDFPYAFNSNLLVKIHGDLDSDDFVLKEDDYIEYDINHPLFEAFIKSVFSTKVVIFIGYSYSDINLKIILQKVRNILGNSFQNSFMITPDSLSSYKINYLKNRGVNAMSYEDHSEFIDDYLSGKNVKGESYNENSGLEGYGDSLFKFLKFIVAYDRFKEDLVEKPILVQMFISLNRFSEISSLPYFFIGNLFPFNGEKKFVYYNEHGIHALKIANENVVNFFKEWVILDDDSLRIKENYAIENKLSLGECNTQLNSIVKLLNNSGIFWVGAEPRDSNSLVNIRLHNDIECQCNQCLFKRLNLSKALDNISINNVSETSHLQSDSSVAYTHYKLGNIYNSYVLFEEVAQKAWHAENYIVYFISKINIKRLGHFLPHAEHNNYDESILEDLRNKSSNIDLEAEYIQISEVSKEESELIKIIRDDILLVEAERYVNESYREVYINYRSSRYQRVYYDNKMSIYKAYSSLVAMIYFYEKNFIVNDYFAKYRSVCNKFNEIIFLDQYTNKKFVEHNSYLNDLMCKNFVLYAEVDEANKFFNRYGIDKIIVNSSVRSDIIKIVKNYLQSFFKINTFWGKKIEPNDKMAYQSNKGVFGNQFTVYFDNAMLLLSKIEISSEEFNDIYTDAISFLEVVTFIHWHSIKYFSEFIFKNSKYIDKNIVEAILNLIYINQGIITKEVLAVLGYILSNKESEERMQDNQLMRYILSQIVVDGLTPRHGIDKIVSIWELSDDKLREYISDIVVNQLAREFDEMIYFDVASRGIIDYSLYFDQYLDYVNKNKANSDRIFREAESGINNNTFISYIEFLRELNIADRDSGFETIEDREDYMDFFIDPVNFDYEKFNIKWLLITFNSKVHEHLSSYKEVRLNFALRLKENFDHQNLKNIFIKYYLEPAFKEIA